MAYTINKTDGSIYAVVADGTIDTGTSLVLVGKNYSGYGEFLNENLFRLLENHANPTQPPNPIVGQLWFDKSTNILKVFNGTDFRSLGGAIAGTTSPTGNNNGDFWWDSFNKQLKVWDTTLNRFVVIGPQSTAEQGLTGSIPEVITDAGATDHLIVRLMVADTVVGVISKSPTFTPNPLLAGFGVIQPGLTLASGYKFNGTATSADALNGVEWNKFLRNDITTAQAVLGNLTVGGTTFAVNDARIVADASGILIYNSSTGNLRLGTASAQTAITIASSGAVSFGSTVSTGALTATSFTGSGAGITTLNASNLASGTVPSDRISGAYTGFTNITGTGTATFATLVGAGSSITALNASNLASGTVPDARLSGNYSGLGHLTPAVTNTNNLGSSALRWNTVYATTFEGTATEALYADLAERFASDVRYEPGTVVRLGGSAEITQENSECSAEVFGVISTNPAYLMNNKIVGLPVALIGRVPVRAVGKIQKNARLVSAGNGCVREATAEELTAFNCIGRALEQKDTNAESLIEAFVTIR